MSELKAYLVRDDNGEDRVVQANSFCMAVTNWKLYMAEQAKAEPDYKPGDEYGWEPTQVVLVSDYPVIV